MKTEKELKTVKNEAEELSENELSEVSGGFTIIDRSNAVKVTDCNCGNSQVKDGKCVKPGSRLSGLCDGCKYK